jgi:hypothetical protein
VGRRVPQARSIVVRHGCTLQRGTSWLLNIEPNRVDVRVRHGRIIWARVF